MTLTVDEVRNIRFPMARQPNEDGYRASAVDNFIDRLEVSYTQLVDENQRLKAGGGGAEDPALRQQFEALRQERDNLLRSQADMQARMASMPAGGDPGQMAAMQARINELTMSNQDLQARLASMAAATPGNSQLAAMQARIDQLTRDNQVLNARLSAMPAAVPGIPPEQMATVTDENAALRSQATLLQSQILELQAKLAIQPAAGPVSGDTRQIVVTTSAEASPAVVLLVQQTLQQVQVLMDNAKREIEEHRIDAEVETRRMMDSASQKIAEMSRKAESDASAMKSDATLSADRVIAEARARASAIDSEAAERRGQIFGQLEREKDQLSERIGQLRDFESQYRSSMTGHLQRQMDSLRDIEFSTTRRPDMFDSSGSSGYSGGIR